MAGIYVHIPFCSQKCYYCDFFSIKVKNNHEIDDFINALKIEIVLQKSYLNSEVVDTIYFGGGTPTLLSVHQIKDIYETIADNFQLSKIIEFTIEANPENLTDEYIDELLNFKAVNRLSIGIQSFFTDDLMFLHRKHDLNNIYKAVYRLTEKQFSNISIDLIYGIPGMNTEKLLYNLNEIIKLDVPHVSAYHLTIEPNTVLYSKYNKQELVPISEDESLAQFLMIHDFLLSKGYVHYEISNYAKPDFFSKHNSNYWKQIKYLGIGPSAHSYNGSSRQWNVNKLNTYIAALTQHQQVFEKELIDFNTQFNEYLLTGLRTISGIDLEYISNNFNKTNTDLLIKNMQKYIKSGHILRNNNICTLTPIGLFISDQIISDLFLV